MAMANQSVFGKKELYAVVLLALISFNNTCPERIPILGMTLEA